MKSMLTMGLVALCVSAAWAQSGATGSGRDHEYEDVVLTSLAYARGERVEARLGKRNKDMTPLRIAVWRHGKHQVVYRRECTEYERKARRFRWDQRDSDGRFVPTGTYVITVVYGREGEPKVGYSFQSAPFRIVRKDPGQFVFQAEKTVLQANGADPNGQRLAGARFIVANRGDSAVELLGAAYLVRSDKSGTRIFSMGPQAYLSDASGRGPRSVNLLQMGRTLDAGQGFELVVQLPVQGSSGLKPGLYTAVMKARVGGEVRTFTTSFVLQDPPSNKERLEKAFQRPLQ